MNSVTTNWMPCGARQRRAVVSAATPEKTTEAAAYYERITQPAMTTVARIDRALHMHREFGAVVVHEYDPE